MANSKRMDPMSGEHVEVSGVYETEWGREVQLDRGDVFPADPVLGDTEWKMVGFPMDQQHTGMTLNPRFGNEVNENEAAKKPKRTQVQE
ncbi:transposase [Paenibacillus gansuensis]|uniref:Transposase n=1 Tax=Paenibacillus gansuensis TaxID=306542 RepID=A0ABW5PFC8_9BACL